MGLFNRRKRHAAWDRGSTREDLKHLEEFTRTHKGVEAYLEPVTMATETTVVLVAHDGDHRREPTALVHPRRATAPQPAAAVPLLVARQPAAVVERLADL